MVFALTGDGVEELKQYLFKKMPPGPWHYPEDQLTDLPERLLAAEITREQILHQLHEELPYEAAVLPEKWEARKDGSTMIKADDCGYASQPSRHCAGQKRCAH